MSTTIQHGIEELLEQAGARPRGKRHECPKCGGLRTVTHTEECFYCHKCGWKGNTVTLAKEIGVYRRLPSEEYRELRRKRERAQEATRRLYAVAHKRQLELREQLRELGRAETLAHEAGPEDPNTWEILSRVYAEQPRIEQELDALESADPKVVFEALRQGRFSAESGGTLGENSLRRV